MDPNTDFERLAVYDIILQFSSLAVFPIICIYIKNCYDDNEVTWVPYLATIPALLLLVLSVIFTSLLGLPRAASLIQLIHSGVVVKSLLTPLDNAYILFNFQIYFVVFYLSLSISLVYVFAKLFTGKFKFKHIAAFLRGEKASFIANVVCLFFVIFFILWGVSVLFSSVFCDTLSIWSTLWSLFTSFILFLVGYAMAVPSLPGGYLSLERLRHPFHPMHQSTQEFLQGIDSGPMAGVATAGYDKIMDSFRQYMDVDHGYLNPALTIEEIARVLNTNRTYVSKLVNLYYGMTFRDYVNKKRLDYAKQLMIDEPDASLEYIAVKSGFQSSTQFIRKFRETESITPTVWKATLKQKK
ncbi:MAG: helix-turn-helix transcriptional regulator [Bacteroidaceae bacterium]|nr:helix-turn-helix transcriptional regulator [Bacteroidaceae bacterium]